MMAWPLAWLLTVLATAAQLNLLAAVATARPANCQEKCGDLIIPYPFGIGPPGCFREGLEVTCHNDTGRAYLGNSNSTLWAFDISLLQGEARVHKHLTWYCYNYTGINHISRWRMSLAYNYKISNTKNKFTAVGCDIIAFIAGVNDHKHRYLSGCASFCYDSANVDDEGQCTGMGCCQTSIPANLTSFDTTFTFENRTSNATVVYFSPCSYAFVVENGWFNFHRSYLADRNFADQYPDGVPLVLNWIAGNESCDKAKKNRKSYACTAENSECVPSVHGVGYLCNCSNGYEGNPYLEEGCQDINECLLGDKYPCLGVCTNTIGSYKCTCPQGTNSSDPTRTKCVSLGRPGQQSSQDVKMILGICISTLILLVCVFSLMTECQKRKLMKETDNFFKQNGGLLLLDQIRSRQVDTLKVFSKEELEKATNNFDRNREVGRGGYGTVYKGILNDRDVAIKLSKVSNMRQKEEFIQEIIILSQINHRNVVRLLGCCLEVEVPILVYEFIPNGTLSQLVQSAGSSISLDSLLRIALESAEALSYLHSSAATSIVHGDIKSSNILLDDNYMAKVSDFGASRMLAKDKAQFMTMIQGTHGYLDPEYLQERQLTEKSDVYSFGVVILELITRKTAIYGEGPEEAKSLASSFLAAMRENKLEALLDRSIIGVGMETLQEIAQLAKECLNMKGEDRPSMTEVADKLKAIRRTWQEQLGGHQVEEAQSLLDNTTAAADYTCSNTAHHEGLTPLDLEVGR